MRHVCSPIRAGIRVAVASAIALCGIAGVNAQSVCGSTRQWPSPPASKNVTISNGGLSVTFNVAWGAVVTGIANQNVAHGLNIVDCNDVGRELNVDEFLFLKIDGRKELMINPTQAGAEGYQGYYQHPHGIVFPEKGSPVVRWTSSRNHFHAVIKPWDYDTGNPTHWVYAMDVRINSQGIAHFHYVFRNHESKTYTMNTEVPTLYSDRTDAFMYPLTSPYRAPESNSSAETNTAWPVKLVAAKPHWPQQALTSQGWIANIDRKDNLGVFYTTPVGLPEVFGTFPGYRAGDGISGDPPLGKSNVSARNLTSYPGEIYSIDFSVLVSSVQAGPALISQQPPAVFKVIRNIAPKAVSQLPHPGATPAERLFP